MDEVKKKNILFLINSLKSGGAERVVSILCNHLYSEYNIHLMLLENDIEFDLNSSIKIIKLNQNYSDPTLIKYLKIPISAYNLNRYCKNNNIEICMSFLSRSNYINVFSKFYFKKYRIIISERTYLSEYIKQLPKLQKIISKSLTKFLYPKADYILSNSNESLLDLKKSFNVHIPSSVIYNPLPIKKIQVLVEEECDYNFQNDIFYYVHVGKLRKEKNHLMLLEAFSLLTQKNNKIKLLIIGDGEMQNDIISSIKRLQLENFVELLGLQKNPFKYVKKSNCLVLSSNFEGLPNVILEGLACGKPIISTDCKSGPREILYEKINTLKSNITELEIADYGILVPVNDFHQMYLAMEIMINNINLYDNYSKKSIKRAQQFDTKNIISIYQKYFDSF